MTVGELIEELSNFDEDSEVVIGMEQYRGTNFAMDIEEVEEHDVSLFCGDDDEEKPFKVVIKEGSQIGSVSFE